MRANAPRDRRSDPKRTDFSAGAVLARFFGSLLFGLVFFDGAIIAILFGMADGAPWESGFGTALVLVLAAVPVICGVLGVFRFEQTLSAVRAVFSTVFDIDERR